MFTDAIEVTTQTGRTWPITLYDLDGDNDLDLIEGQVSSRVNRVFLNTTSQDGNLGFRSGVDIGTDAFTTNALALGDVNSDGFVDLVTGDHSSVNHLYYGDGNGGFSASVEIQPGQAWSTFALALADVNGDGDLDLIEGAQRDAADQNGESRIYLNNNAGGFLAPTLLTGSNNLHTTVAFITLDYDRDGDIDIVEGNNGSWDHDSDVGTAEISQPNRLFLNDGTGQFPTVVEITPGSSEQTYGLAAGDFDGDGIVDFIAGNQIGENMTYYVTGTSTANSFRQLQSVAESLRIDDGTQGNVRFARIRIDPLNISQPAASELNFFLSNDDGANYVPAPLDRPMEFPASTLLPVRWKVEMSANSPNLARLPTVTELTITDGDIFPRFIGPDSISGTLGNPINPVQLNFVDDDGDRLSYVLTSLPAGSGLLLDQEAGIISGTVTSADAAAAPYTMSARAFDGVRFSPSNQGRIEFTLGGPNTPPIANNDGPFVINEGEPVAGNPNVLTNDTDANGDALTAALVSPPLNDDGSFVLNADGTFSYTHDGSETASDSFTYTANDQVGPSNIATVSITITPVNDAPQVVSPIGAQTVTEGTAGSVSVAGAFSDPDGDTLTFSETGLPASLTLSADGTISGTAGAADVGTHNVTITATDPSGESASDNFVLTVEAAAPPPPPPPPPPAPRSSGGCTIGPADGTIDPTLPLLMLISLVYLHRRRFRET